MISETLFRAQWLGKEKAGNDEGAPKGPYGDVYAARRALTLRTHPEWSPMHRKNDAQRVMVKTMLRDLRRAWVDEMRERSDVGLTLTITAPDLPKTMMDIELAHGSAA